MRGNYKGEEVYIQHLQLDIQAPRVERPPSPPLLMYIPFRFGTVAGGRSLYVPAVQGRVFIGGPSNSMYLHEQVQGFSEDLLRLSKLLRLISIALHSFDDAGVGDDALRRRRTMLFLLSRLLSKSTEPWKNHRKLVPEV